MPDKAGVEVYRYARMTADSLVRIGRNARTRTATDGSVSAGKRPCWATKTDGISRAMGHDDFRCTGMLRDGKERFSDRGTEAWCEEVFEIALRKIVRILSPISRRLSRAMNERSETRVDASVYLVAYASFSSRVASLPKSTKVRSMSCSVRLLCVHVIACPAAYTLPMQTRLRNGADP